MKHRVPFIVAELRRAAEELNRRHRSSGWWQMVRDASDPDQITVSPDWSVLTRLRSTLNWHFRDYPLTGHRLGIAKATRLTLAGH